MSNKIMISFNYISIEMQCQGFQQNGKMFLIIDEMYQ